MNTGKPRVRDKVTLTRHTDTFDASVTGICSTVSTDDSGCVLVLDDGFADSTVYPVNPKGWNLESLIPISKLPDMSAAEEGRDYEFIGDDGVRVTYRRGDETDRRVWRLGDNWHSSEDLVENHSATLPLHHIPSHTTKDPAERASRKAGTR